MKTFKSLLLIGLIFITSNTFASTPRWIDLKDTDGKNVLTFQNNKIQIDVANTIGWGQQKMKVFYKVIFKTPVKSSIGVEVDEEHFEVNISCSNLYPAYLIERNWYLNGKHTHIFTYGKGERTSTLVTQNLPVFYIIKIACPEFDPDSVEDLDDNPFGLT